ncbi:uncharacterized protein BDR25DRAFT_207602, partial [Lindgomyces ingoldianus]
SATAKCTRESMTYGTEYYILAQQQGQIDTLSVIDSVPYTENRNKTDFLWGIISHSLILDWNHTIYDPTSCKSFVELVGTDLKSRQPYVLGMTMKFDDEKGEEIQAMDALVTTTGDWLFNASQTLIYFQREKPWTIIPEPKRDTRATLKAAADAYADIFSNHSVVVPFGTPCCRVEGGASTCANSTMLGANTCVLGIPDAAHPQHLRDRAYVIDEEYGTVQVSMDFAGLPDSHMFRVEGGKIRAVHTMTACGALKCHITNETLRRSIWEGRWGHASLSG